MGNVFRFFLICSATCVLLAACSTVSDQQQVACRFIQLKEAGKLPGFGSGEHGHMHTQGYPLASHITYPASMVVYATKEHDPDRYAYTFTKENESSDWRLSAAVRTASDGHREDLKIE
jgi:hypothetical protein